MIGLITIKNYSITSEQVGKRVLNAVLKEAWFDAGRYFHEHFRDLRFTREHALKAGYTKRKGEGLPDKQFKRSYTGRKFRQFGHTRPLEFTGDTRRAVKMANISSTSSGAKVAYAGARVFNYHNPLSDPAMNLAEEFRKILPEEAEQLAMILDQGMYRLNDSQTPEVSQLLASAGL